MALQFYNPNAAAGPTVTLLNNVTATGASDSYALPVVSGQVPPRLTWVVTFKTAAPTAQTTNLEGSLDNVNWYTLDSSTNLDYTSDTVSGEMLHITNKPVKFVRANLATYTAGSNAGVTVKFLASVN
jgi:hypothetical protein